MEARPHDEDGGGQAERFGAGIVYDDVTKPELDRRREEDIHLGNGDVVEALAVTGRPDRVPLARARRRDLRPLGYGASPCATCDGAFFKQKKKSRSSAAATPRSRRPRSSRSFARPR